MAIGVQLNGLSIQLGQLERQIKHTSLRLIAEGTRPTVDDPNYRDFFSTLQRWEERLGLIARRLRSLEGELGLKGQRAKGAPQEHRFRAHQSVADQEKQLAIVKQQASRATAYLLRIYQIALTPTDLDINKGVFHLVEQGLDEYQAFLELQKLGAQQKSATVTAIVAKAQEELQPVRPNVSDPLVVLMLVAQLLRIWWLERLRQENREKTT